jgi:hypothetical protein
VARAVYWLGVTFWEELKEEFKAESLDLKSLVLVRLFTCFASSLIPLFTTPLLTQFFCSCSASIVLERLRPRLWLEQDAWRQQNGTKGGQQVQRTVESVEGGSF